MKPCTQPRKRAGISASRKWTFNFFVMPSCMLHSGAHRFKYGDFVSQGGCRIRYASMPPAKKAIDQILLLLHGRGECIEKYHGIACDLACKGFWVFTFDWRGQGLSCRETDNPHKGHVQSFQDYEDDLSIFYSQLIKPFGLPVYLLTHSMGGNIALRFMSRYPDQIKKAVLAAPMIDLSLPGWLKKTARVLCATAAKTSFARHYTFGSADYSPNSAAVRHARLTHDPDNNLILHQEIQKNPDLALGGVTWGWLNAAFESMDDIAQDHVVKRITTPILLASAQKDTIVCPRAQKTFSRRLPDCTFLPVLQAYHEIMFESCEINQVFWDAVDRFYGLRMRQPV